MLRYLVCVSLQLLIMCQLKNYSKMPKKVTVMSLLVTRYSIALLVVSFHDKNMYRYIRIL